MLCEQLKHRQIKVKTILAEQDKILFNPKPAVAAAAANLLAESGVEYNSYRSFQTHKKRLTKAYMAHCKKLNCLA